MKSIGYTQKKIPVSKLKLDKENPRIVSILGTNASENEIITYLLKHEGAKDLAKEMHEEGIFHADSMPWCIEDKNDPGTYIVAEGNRRLACIIALQNPKNFGLTIPKTKIATAINCLVYNDIPLLKKRIAKRHTESEIKRWSGLSQASFTYEEWIKNPQDPLNNNQKNNIKLFLFHKKVREFNTHITDIFEKKGAISTIERLFITDIPQKLGFKFNEKYETCITDKERFKHCINTIVNWIYTDEKPVDTRTFLNREKTIEFIDNNFPNAKTKATNTLPSTETAPSSTRQALPLKTTKRKKQRLQERKTYIPYEEDNFVSEKFSKIYTIFEELRTINLKDGKYCICAGIRMLLEQSIKVYYKEVLKKDDDEIKNLSGALPKAINSILDRYQQQNKLPQRDSRGLRKSLSGSTVLGCEALNDIIHGEKYDIFDGDLLSHWKILKPFLTLLWDEIKSV